MTACLSFRTWNGLFCFAFLSFSSVHLFHMAHILLTTDNLKIKTLLFYKTMFFGGGSPITYKF